MLRQLFQRYSTRKKTESKAYLELTEENLNIHVPSNPGLYMLALKLGKDVYYTFHTNQTDNLYRRLREIMHEHQDQEPSRYRRGFKRVQTYFTYFPFSRYDQRCDIEKMFAASIYLEQPRVINNN